MNQGTMRPLKLGVIGDPIAHSKSPIMHAAALRERGIAGDYEALHVKPEQLEAAIAAVREEEYRGINVTIPHKEQVMRYLDELGEDALRIGAVNTIVNENGRLIGRNTDGIGYVRSLKEEAAAELAGRRIVVLGAGGAARGIVYALASEAPQRVTLLNRTTERAKALAREWSDLADIAALPSDRAAEALRDADIVINTTSVGMHPHVDEVPIDPSLLRGTEIVSDLIYNPLETKLLRLAGEKGCRIHGGLGMFVYQGAYAFEYWTGVSAPAEAMRRAVLESMNTGTNWVKER
ncbi:shikimate dehydrogenase [Saccharibacillus alkalitolerans]|uniref:Shikimate dehydrogenase (NADP(+)) n=1 Tax=Saccharibacillus alkalitolerans TaxID=2705290 RepID=A0ABX0EYD9_9BACL|nr:shikimate dehydrogenase [Saccharibacillus alkalitolerans]NGZ73762.1 shikimate dehydrogenase [Saccharibacillus alkalitolerans]